MFFTILKRWVWNQIFHRRINIVDSQRRLFYQMFVKSFNNWWQTKRSWLFVLMLERLNCFGFVQVFRFLNELFFPASILRAIISTDICTVKIKKYQKYALFWPIKFQIFCIVFCFILKPLLVLKIHIFLSWLAWFRRGNGLIRKLELEQKHWTYFQISQKAKAFRQKFGNRN